MPDTRGRSWLVTKTAERTGSGWPVLRGSISMVLLIASLAALFMLKLVLGSVAIPVSDVVGILLGNGSDNAGWVAIVLNYRLPTAVVGIFAGASLAVAGLLMQTLFRNPLAGPDVFGLSAGASLGVAVVVLSAGTAGASSTILGNLGPFGSIGIAVAASIGSGLVLLMILIASRRIRSSMTILILGLMFGYTASSFISILMHFALAERIQAYTVWSFGSFGGATWDQIQVLVLFASVGLLVGACQVKNLNALLLGEQYAESMGLDFRRTRNVIFVTTAVLSGTVTAFCGPIAFIGIAVPHLCRALFSTANHAVLVPACILLGACLAVAADIIASVPGNEITLPLNAITSLIGAPVVIWVIFSKNRQGMEMSV
ncbi:MAG: iron ABC transporter permease [Methanoculleus sp.]|nr:iron ABC transporter permease [Methanoculleus sp.]